MTICQKFVNRGTPVFHNNGEFFPRQGKGFRTITPLVGLELNRLPKKAKRFSRNTYRYRDVYYENLKRGDAATLFCRTSSRPTTLPCFNVSKSMTTMLQPIQQLQLPLWRYSTRKTCPRQRLLNREQSFNKTRATTSAKTTTMD